MTHNSHHLTQRDRGAIAVFAALAFIPITIALAVVADSGRAWVARHSLQNGVEAAAGAAAQTWLTGGTSCASSALALATADGATTSSISCSVTGSRTSGTVKVVATSRVPLVFASLLGRDHATVTASTTARIGPASKAIGVSPMALCAGNPAIASWIASGMTSTVTSTITFETATPVCGGTTPGNWGMLDFNGGSNSTSDFVDWVVNGYPSTLSVGDVVPGDPGAPATSAGISSVVGTSFIIPLFSAPTGTGSGARYPIVGFAQVHLVSAKLTGNSKTRSLTIRFERGITSGSVTQLGGGGTNYGVSAWGICSYDSQGQCS